MEPIPQLPPLTDLITSLEQATHSAKQLPTSTDQTHFLNLISSLHSTTHQLTSFLHHLPAPTPTPTPTLTPHPQVAENSVSSAVGGEEEPMQIGDGEEEEGDNTQEENSSSMIVIDRVEERLRNCVIQNKRRKRRLSPVSMGVEQRRVYGDGGRCGGGGGGGGGIVEVGDGFDPRRSQLRGFDLVFQFHG